MIIPNHILPEIKEYIYLIDHIHLTNEELNSSFIKFGKYFNCPQISKTNTIHKNALFIYNNFNKYIDWY